MNHTHPEHSEQPHINPSESTHAAAPAAAVVPKRDLSALYIPASIIVAAVIIGLGLFFGLSRSAVPAPADGATPKAAAVNIKDVKITADTPFIGKADAPVTLAYWYDYQCPFCKAVDIGGVQGINIDPSFPTLIKNYVATGKLRIVFKAFPFLGNDSITAALYEHAIWKMNPDKFYQWHEAMFKAQDEEGDKGFGDEPSILKLIKTIPGLNAEALKADVAANSAAYKTLIAADRDEGAKFGITGTPGFITGKTLIPGAVPLTQFTAAIDPQLK